MSLAPNAKGPVIEACKEAKQTTAQLRSELEDLNGRFICKDDDRDIAIESLSEVEKILSALENTPLEHNLLAIGYGTLGDLSTMAGELSERRRDQLKKISASSRALQEAAKAANDAIKP